MSRLLQRNHIHSLLSVSLSRVGHWLHFDVVLVVLWFLLAFHYKNYLPISTYSGFRTFLEMTCKTCQIPLLPSVTAMPHRYGEYAYTVKH